MRFYIIAIQFLTIIPLPFAVRCEKDDLGRSTALFPLAGLTIGAILVAINWLISPWLARPLCDALLITALAAVTGGLHLDGLADVCDGLAARGGRERFLSVMKDSQVGAIGAVGLVLALLLKWQALVAVPNEIKLQTLLLFPALARFGQTLMLTGARHAREDGLGAAFVKEMNKLVLVFALIVAASVAFLLLKIQGIVALFTVIFVVFSVRSYFQKRLGGITGDVIGCASELSEIAVLVLLSINRQI